MSEIGTEVGQKMKLAIIAKLSELNCYVDDELPDYIMVMIANKRTKAQMKEDLNLFLATETSFFVDWLHIVLRKLKQVHVTNPDVFKNVLKRRICESTEFEEKLFKKAKEETKYEMSEPDSTSIDAKTDEYETTLIGSSDSFNIPLLSEIESAPAKTPSRLIVFESTNKELDDESEPGTDTSSTVRPKSPITTKQLFSNKRGTEATSERDNIGSKYDHSFKHRDNYNRNERKKPSILDRIGKRVEPKSRHDSLNSKIVRPARNIKIPKQAGLQSKVLVPQRKVVHEEVPEYESTLKEVKKVDSTVLIKPRVISAEAKQANVSLLFKAVAEAQRSVSQTPRVGKETEKGSLFSASYRKKLRQQELDAIKLEAKVAKNLKTRNELKNKKFTIKEDAESISEDSMQIEKDAIVNNAKITDKFTEDATKPKYNASCNENEADNTKDEIDCNLQDETSDEEPIPNQKFIVTLDNLDKFKFERAKKLAGDRKTGIFSKSNIGVVKEVSQSSTVRQKPTPITFEASNNKSPKFEKSSAVGTFQTSNRYKIKGVCKYYPQCREGNRCEFIHPVKCKHFPECKYADKCFYIHPMCKFESSCTRKNCIYSHKPPMAKMYS